MTAGSAPNGLSELTDVGPTDEGLSGSRDHNAKDALAVCGMRQCLIQSCTHVLGESVDRRIVDGDDQHSFAQLSGNSAGEGDNS